MLAGDVPFIFPHRFPKALVADLMLQTRKPHYFTEEAFSDAQRHLAGLLLFFASFV